jgi:hypothetical protein
MRLPLRPSIAENAVWPPKLKRFVPALIRRGWIVQHTFFADPLGRCSKTNSLKLDLEVCNVMSWLLVPRTGALILQVILFPIRSPNLKLETAEATKPVNMLPYTLP